MIKQCPLCDWNKSHRAWNRHMVKAHGWRYLNGAIPEPPPDNKHPWTVRDDKWVCLDESCEAGKS